jgi:hypothetical protein
MQEKKPDLQMLAKIAIKSAYQDALSNPFSILCLLIQVLGDTFTMQDLLEEFEGTMHYIAKRLEELSKEEK